MTTFKLSVALGIQRPRYSCFLLVVADPSSSGLCWGPQFHCLFFLLLATSTRDWGPLCLFRPGSWCHLSVSNSGFPFFSQLPFFSCLTHLFRHWQIQRSAPLRVGIFPYPSLIVCKMGPHGPLRTSSIGPGQTPAAKYLQTGHCPPPEFVTDCSLQSQTLALMQVEP